jgi:hypothetical protein
MHTGAALDTSYQRHSHRRCDDGFTGAGHYVFSLQSPSLSCGRIEGRVTPHTSPIEPS